jgi:uncharacterized protein (DUF697 family)
MQSFAFDEWEADVTTADDGIPNPTSFHIPSLEHLKGLFAAHREKEMASMEVANIIVAGGAGVGKSTLINAMFGADFAKTGVGKPITAQVEKIVAPGRPIALYDTRGLEIRDSAGTVGALSDLIKSLRTNEDAREQIHCLWLCVSADSNRIEDVHTGIVQMCRDYRIPVIFVLTKDYLGCEEFESFIRKEFPDVAGVVPVVALARQGSRGDLIPQFGLGTLLDVTLEVIPEAVKASVEFAQIAVIERKITAARNIVNWSAGTGVATAFPLSIIPFAHSALLVPLQINMIVQINKALGIEMTEEDSKSLMVGLSGVIAATVGGKAIFVELIKIIPGAGTVVGMIIGASVAGTVVKALGEVYIAYMVEALANTKPMDHRSILSGLSDRIKSESWRFKNKSN